MPVSFPTPRPPAPFRGYAEAALLVAASTLAGLAVAPRWGESAVDLLYLPAVLGVALWAGLWPSLFAAFASALAYNYFFTQPRLTFRIERPNDLVTVVVLFAVATVTSQLAASVRRQARLAHAHAGRNATIAGLSRGLLSCTSPREIAEVATRELGRIFECNAVLIGSDSGEPLAAAPRPVALAPNDAAAAALTLASGDRTGRGVDRAVPTEWQFHPVRSAAGVIAALGLARDDGLPAARADQLELLDGLLDQVALALERARLEGEAREFTRLRERDTVRSALLATIGQDLAEPFRRIAAASGALRRAGLGDRTLLAALGTETARLDRYLANLLELGPDEDGAPIVAGPLSIDLFHRTVRRDGEPVHLTPKEYAVLAELAKHPGRVLSHAHLLRTAWGPAQENQIEYLRVAVRGLRQKLERDSAHPSLIVNEPSVGYRLRVD